MKWLIHVVLLVLSFSAFSIDKNVLADGCASPEECISKISMVIDKSRTPGTYPSKSEQAVIKKLLMFGEEAMPLIVQLLEDDEKLIARIGAIALSETEHIDKVFLPQIARGLEKDIAWLAPALARVGTAEAANIAVKAFLAAKSSPRNQEAYTIQLFGNKALPAVISAIKCEFGCNEKTYYLLGTVLHEMDDHHAEFAQALISLAEDVSLSDSVRQGTLQILRFLYKSAPIIEFRLVAIREKEPQLVDVVNDALVGIKSKYAGRVLTDRLIKEADIYLLRDIAELGTNAIDAGPVVVKLLNSQDPEIKLLAARTLGYIEYTKAAPYLISLLHESNDVQLNRVAAESLGRMKFKAAIPELVIVAKRHWYPPVRDVAMKAIEHIKSGKAYESKFHERNFALEYFSFKNINIASCKDTTLAYKAESSEQKIYESNSNGRLEKLAYNAVVIGYSADDEAEQKAIDPEAIIEVNASNIIEQRHDIEHIPEVALRVEGGWFVGGDRGEWGGELVYISDSGQKEYILQDNIEDIYKLGNRYIALSGIAHLGINYGVVYEVFLENENKWQARQWIRLPAAPGSSWVVETGDVLINTYGGGSILLSETGSIQMAKCK